MPESNIGVMQEPDVPAQPNPPTPPRPRGGGRLRSLLRRASATLPDSRVDRAVVVATLTAIILVGGSSVAILQSTPKEQRLAFDAPTLVTAEPSTTTTLGETTSTTLAVPVPAAAVRRPQPPPGDVRAPTPIIQIGEMRIPKIGLVHPIYEGVTLTVIDHGPGHWPGSAMPGELGNTVFAGHRVTHSHPMRHIDQLVEGDEVIFATAAGTFTYRVTGHEIVTPKDVHIVNPTPDATMTIFGCHPPGSAKQRYVVRGALASSTPA